ncbi:DUF2179 domain-containing protein [Candidatus Contubernalis alkaliaceticus]|uniref:DUF2179 domain-containing protein n=1 Tax=Candidatus Contubernalis alkaliaceticus TaxID=338645 RepID=UPI001F4C2863|nr:DUF5698 domain-containing protein [Candidatus Contubernalis alkalaceticus]UNC92973.1 DUF2179 domain-containing protein [Candidatus Contubernalis alkalaceticus]
MPFILTALLILLARVIDVSLGTIRILLLMQGSRGYAAIIGFFECLIYIFILGMMVQHLDSPINLIFYSLGFALGNYIGSLLEEKIAIGHVTLQLISKHCSYQLIKEIRNLGYGVTVCNGYGKDQAERCLLHILTKRKKLAILLKHIEAIDKECFITVLDAKKISGGFFGQDTFNQKVPLFSKKNAAFKLAKAKKI